MRHEVRVIFGDTDQMGVVYYANYLRYFEGEVAVLHVGGVRRARRAINRWGPGRSAG